MEDHLATKALGTVLKQDATTITNNAKLTGPSSETKTAETTNLSSTCAEFVPTITDNGEINMDIFYDPTDATHQILTGLRNSPALVAWTLIYPNGTNQEAFNAILTKFEPDFDPADVIKASITLKVSGALTTT